MRFVVGKSFTLGRILAVRKALSFLSVASLVLFASLAGCGSNLNSSNSAPMVLTVQDQAPTGLTVLSFGIQITNVTLVGSGNQSNVTLVSNPVSLNLANLMAMNALLADRDVPAGTYSSMSITFSTPRLSVLNNSGGAFTDGTTSCPTTTV